MRHWRTWFSPIQWIGLSITLLTTGPVLAGQLPTSGIPHFKDIARSAGINVSHISTQEMNNVIETMSGGVGFIDCDNDGKLDVITVNGSTMQRYKTGGDPMITLYHQEDGLRFKDITARAGLTRKGWGMGVAVADFDNDGRLDIYVTGFGGSVLYRNKGNCRFEDVTRQAGMGADGFPLGPAWGDYDRDGQVDLFVPRYAQVDIQQPSNNARDCLFLGLHVFCGPWNFPSETDLLFHNLGHGKFEEVSSHAGVQNSQGLHSIQGLWIDYDKDGWPDLYVTNDRGPNYLFQNRHDGTFEEVGLLSGTALSTNGQPEGSMGVDAADYLHDGHPGLFVTNFMQEPDTLYRSIGIQGFDNISILSGLARATLPYVGWGTGFVDFTNDGWDDIFLANGHIYPQINQANIGLFYREPLFLFHNNHDGTFTDISRLAGLDRLPLESRRGVAFGDVNNDGKEDVLILNVAAPPTLLLNCTQNLDHAVLLQMIGSISNRAGIGARVIVKTAGRTQTSEVRGGGSYLSQNDLRLHFGLGRHTRIDSVEIEWPSGARQTFHNLASDFLYTIKEGKGIIHRVRFAKTPSCDGNGLRMAEQSHTESRTSPKLPALKEKSVSARKDRKNPQNQKAVSRTSKF